jgi:hypothetical protein
MQKNNNKIDHGYYIWFLIWPMWSFIESLRQYRNPISRNIVWLFIIFYGYVITSPDYETDTDLMRRVEFFKSWAADYGAGFDAYLERLNDDEEGHTDVVESFLMFSISRVTNNHRILFMIYGILFGFFYTRNIWFVFDRIKSNLNKYSIPFFLAVLIIVPFWNLGIFRFYFASQIFIFGMLRYISSKKRLNILICLAAVTVHFSFFFANLFALIYMFSGNRTNVYFIIFLSSLLFSNINIESINQSIDFLPKTMERKAVGYTSSDYVEEVRENINDINNRWYLNGRMIAGKFAIALFLILAFLNRKKFENDIFLYNCFNFALLFVAGSFFVNEIPSMDRFLRVSYFFALAFGLLLLTSNIDNVMFWRLSKFMTWPIYLYIIVEVRTGFDTIGLVTVVGNIIFIPFMEENIALIEFIKNIGK